MKKLLALLFALLATPVAAQTIPAGAWGSINYWGVGGLSQVLAPGLAGQCLTTQNVGSAPIWVNCQVSSLSLLPPISANSIMANNTLNFVAPQAIDVNRVLDMVGYDIIRPPAVESIIYKSNVGPNFNWQTLPPGFTGQLLTSGGPTNPPFWSPSSTQADLAGICQTVGAVLYFDTPSLLWKCLNPGTSGQLLQTGGPVGNPSWLTVTLATLGGVPSTRNVNTSSPLGGGGALSADLTLTCATCATTTNGGALSATAPIVLSAAGNVSMANQGTTTTVLHGNAAGNPAFSAVAVSTDVSGLGTGVATALGVNVGSAGAFVAFNGALGTPSSGTLTSATGLPISTGVSGLGTGVATALGVNVGTAGAFVVNGGVLGTPSSGVGTNLTGTASGLTAGNVTTNANLTGPVTSVGNATTIGTNQVSRANEAQGVARSVIGVTGNATANVADIQGTANQALVVNSGGTALTFGQVNLAAAAAVTGTLPIANGGTNDTGTAWGTYTPSVTCGTATFTTQNARFKTLGKTVFIQLEATMTALGTCTNLISFTLPNTAQSGGSLAGRDTGFSGKGEACVITSASATTSCSLADFTNFTNAMKLIISGVYESQ